MESPYKRVELAVLLEKGKTEEEADEAEPLAEYPSVMYKTHDEAFKNDDVIKAYAVIHVSTGDLYLELVSEKLSRVDYIKLMLQDRTDPQYGKILENEVYIQYHVKKFDRVIHDEMLVSEN